MNTVLREAQKETTKLVEETTSPASDISYQPQAWTREGRTD